jgi:hypothetical protein
LVLGQASTKNPERTGAKKLRDQLLSKQWKPFSPVIYGKNLMLGALKTFLMRKIICAFLCKCAPKKISHLNSDEIIFRGCVRRVRVLCVHSMLVFKILNRWRAIVKKKKKKKKG